MSKQGVAAIVDAKNDASKLSNRIAHLKRKIPGMESDVAYHRGRAENKGLAPAERQRAHGAWQKLVGELSALKAELPATQNALLELQRETIKEHAFTSEGKPRSWLAGTVSAR